MDKVEDKISIRQFFIIYVIGVSASIIRILPIYSSFFAKEATWISAIVAVIPVCILIYILYKIMRNGKDESLADSFENILGKPIAKIFMTMYLILSIILLTFRIRYFAEKCMTALFTNVQIEFFVISILFVVYLIAKKNIQGFARFSEFMWIPLIVFTVGVFLISIPDIKISNIYPVTIYDTKNILMGVLPIISVFVYIPCMLFLGDKVSKKEEMFKVGKKYMLMAVIIAVSIIFTTIGVLGYNLSQDMIQPYFSSLKNIELFTVIERVEALAITFWLVTDIVLIITLVYVVTTLIKKIFNLSNRSNLVSPTLFLVYVLSIFIASNIFEIEDYSKGLGAIIYIAFGTILPIIIYLIGKLRKVID